MAKDGRLFLRNRDKILGIVLINVQVMQIETIIHFYSLFQLDFEGNYMIFLEEDSSTILFSCQNGYLLN